MFDLSCQPAIPLVSGIPIAVEQAQALKAKPSSSQVDEVPQQMEDVQVHDMPLTVLVPHARCQVPRTQLTFSQIIKAVMVLAILSQKASKLKTPKPCIFIGDVPFSGDLSDLPGLKNLYEMEIKLNRGTIVLNKEAQLD